MQNYAIFARKNIKYFFFSHLNLLFLGYKFAKLKWDYSIAICVWNQITCIKDHFDHFMKHYYYHNGYHKSGEEKHVSLTSINNLLTRKLRETKALQMAPSPSISNLQGKHFTINWIFHLTILQNFIFWIIKIHEEFVSFSDFSGVSNVLLNLIIFKLVLPRIKFRAFFHFCF